VKAECVKSSVNIAEVVEEPVIFELPEPERVISTDWSVPRLGLNWGKMRVSDNSVSA
jgi:hypothetical protein